MTASHAEDDGVGTRTQGPDIGDIFSRYGAPVLLHGTFSAAQRKTARDIARCRTAELGGHLDQCDQCGSIRPSYNSCRNRHCPKCQSTRQAQWLALRMARVLAVPHYHVVFTIPGQLRRLFQEDPEQSYDLLFKAASETLLQFGRDPQWIGGQLGLTMVLHTWTRDLAFHPHVHCIVTAGGLSADGQRWLTPKQPTQFLFPTKALAKVFRAKLLEGLRQRALIKYPNSTGGIDARLARLLGAMWKLKWNVYAKKPFASPDHVFKYLGRYTHRVGISNHRLVSVADDAIVFKTKNGKSTRLTPEEFIKRFLQHVLPDRFVKIRHYGLYASANVQTRLELARGLVPPMAPRGPQLVTRTADGKLKPLDWCPLLTAMTGRDPRLCPHCGKGLMHPTELLQPISPRGPP